MVNRRLAAIVALGCALTAAPAWADDPHDPTMRSAAARARDRAVIRQLNLRELAHVRQRDARLAHRQDAARAEHRRRLRDYDRRRERYRQDMAEWRHTVSACRAGDYRYCAR